MEYLNSDGVRWRCFVRTRGEEDGGIVGDE